MRSAPVQPRHGVDINKSTGNLRILIGWLNVPKKKIPFVGPHECHASAACGAVPGNKSTRPLRRMTLVNSTPLKLLKASSEAANYMFV